MNRKQRRARETNFLKAVKQNEPSEKSTTERFQDWVNAHPMCKCMKLKPDNAGIPKGTPDLLICVMGIMVLLEFKKWGNKSTPIQKFQQKQWRKACCVVAEVHSFDEAQRVVQQLIDSFEVVGKATKKVKRLQSNE